MNLGFDAKRLYCNFTGLGNYSRTLVKNLQKLYPENEYNLYTSKVRDSLETSFFYNNSSFKTHKSKAVFESLWRSFSIVNQLKKDRVELFHGLSNEIPFNIQKSGIKSIVTIHDLIFKVLPETYPFVDRLIYDFKFKNSCKNASKIIAISNSTKNDIVKYYAISPDKIKVVYQSCNPIFYDSFYENEPESVLKEYNIPSDYVLCVGSIERRKNLFGVIEAYNYLKPEFRIPLVIIGGNKSKKYSKILHDLIRANRLEKKVFWISNLKDNISLKYIYQRALAFIYPSFYEGFGLPVVEALLSRTPVITSNLSSLPEAGGENSLYVDPKQPNEIANAIVKVLDSSSLREKMVSTGYEYAIQNFSPDYVTEQLYSCYKQTLEESK